MRSHFGAPHFYSPGLVVLALCLTSVAVDAGHELPFYPSFYPQEIRIERLDRAQAATLLAQSAIHAYVGADPFAGAAPPPNVTRVESLGTYVVATFNARSLTDRATRCAAAARLRGALASAGGDWVYHPYPVTPYHGDYLQHHDLAQAARKDAASVPASGVALRVRARGRRVGALLGSRGLGGDAPWDVIVEEVEVGRLLDPRRIALDGWLGPPWIKAGWFHAYLLLGSEIVDAATRRSADVAYERLVTGAAASGIERIDLERRLVLALAGGCERVVLGYTSLREPFNSEYSKGVENVGRDSHDGLGSAIFVRTVKLKDFPWNGWVRLGVESAPAAAWNPVAGFTDPAGRLVWAALGDPALLPAPSGGGWLPNRVTAATTAPAAGLEIPADAVTPEPGTGALVKIGPGRRAAVKIEYRVRASAFHDGTRMTVADALYPFVLAWRWGVKPPRGGDHDATIEAWSALARERVAAVRVVKVETIVREYGDTKFVYDVPVIEVYLNPAATDENVAVAPPWSTAPWHVIALMEEAVRRGLGAFSERAAAQRGVPWLDLARDAKTGAALASLVDAFRAQGWVPPALKGMVTPDEARQRWTALKAFHDAHRHFLVTNGPYRLKQWSADAVVLDVFRDLTYPIGVGAFDVHAIPRRAYASKVEDRGDRLELRVDVERVSKFGRDFEILREPLGAVRPGTDEETLPVCRYVVVGPRGDVVRAGLASRTPAGVYVVALDGLPGGRYTVMLALAMHDNAVDPAVIAVEHRVDAR